MDSPIRAPKAAASTPVFDEMSTTSPVPTVATTTEQTDVAMDTFGVKREVFAKPLVPSAHSDGMSWSKNLERRGGFWGNAFWYDLQLERRMPHAKTMLQELVLALPPCDGKTILDLCAGSGRASAAVLAAYPTAQFTLLDSAVERLQMATQRLEAVQSGVSMTIQFIEKMVEPSATTELSKEPVDVVIACLAFHVLAEKPAHYAKTAASSLAPVSKEETYDHLFRTVWRTLRPGGHLVFADHVGQLALFKQLQALERAGFEDVDCAWRKDDSFVAGGRKPLQMTDAA